MAFDSDQPVQTLVSWQREDPQAEARTRSVQDFLTQAQARFHMVADAEAWLRKQQLDDLRFRASEQWPEYIKNQRALDNRPLIVINRLPQFIRQVTNQARQSRPAIQVNPVDSGSDPKTAEVLQGIIRHIESNSDADVAYQTACEHQATIGRGYFRVLTEFAEDDSFEQEIKIKRIRNPFTVYMDPTCQEADYSDARFGFIVEDMPKETFRLRFPQSTMASLTNFMSMGDQAPDWMPEGKVRVAEYFYVEEVPQRLLLVQFADGRQFTISEEQYLEVMAGPYGQTDQYFVGSEIVNHRDTRRRMVKWCLINAVEVLEGNQDLTAGRDWPGRWIPIVPVIGDELDINGRVDLRGMVRDAKDPQRAYNYWVTSLTEAIALAPKAPFIGVEGQFKGHESKWNQANVRNFSYLEYARVSVDGKPAPMPQRQTAEPAIQAMIAAVQQADNDMKATMGLYDASLGQRGPEQSGKAILARQRQGELGNSNWIDNLGRSVRHCGRLLLDLIPKIYDTPRVLRILGNDDKPKAVVVHSGQQTAPPENAVLPEGVERIYDLATGRYDVTLSMTSQLSRRQEAVEAMVQLVQAYPQAFQIIGDLLAENMDWPGAQKVAERLRKMLPPNLQGEDGGQPEMPPEAQQLITQLQQQLEQATQVAQQQAQALQTDAQKVASEERLRQLDLASRERMAEAQIRAELTIAAGKLQAERQEALMKVELEQIKQQQTQQHELVMAHEAHWRNLQTPPAPRRPQE